MAIQDISNLAISASFQQLLQVSGSVIGTATGSQIDSLDISASYASNAGNASTASFANTATSASHAVQADNATTASFALTASYAQNIPVVETGSLLQTASISDATITFEKADASTFALTVNNVASATSASHAIQADSALAADTATSASHAVQADNATTATSASHALFADEAENAAHADAIQYPVIAKETLDKGDPVYISGYSNGQEKLEVLKADASDPSKMPVVGLAMEDAVNNDPIFIIAGGSFKDVDTDTGLNNPQVGDTLYVAVGGGYTNVKPTGSATVNASLSVRLVE